jgi:hypothetical protein
MDLDTMLAEAAPARRASLDGPDSPAAVSLYQRITAEPAAPARGFRRRWLPPLALTGAVVATVTAAVTLALIAGSRPTTAHTRRGGTAPATLAAWTVAREPNGLVAVTIRELRDPAGLWRMLRADGVPANVRFLSHSFTPTTSASAIPRACHPPPMSDAANAHLQEKIMPQVGPGAGAPIPSGGAVNLTIRPSAIPRGIGLYLEAWAASSGAQTGPILSLQTDLVLASPSCTGS